MSKYHAGGRLKASEWNELSSVDEHPTRVFCIYCNENIIKKIERVKAHLERCTKKRQALSESEPCCSTSSRQSSISNESDSNVSETSQANDSDMNHMMTDISIENLSPSTSQTRCYTPVTSTSTKIKKQKTLFICMCNNT